MSDGDPSYHPYQLPGQQPRHEPPEAAVPIPESVDAEDPFGPAAVTRKHMAAVQAIGAARHLRRVARRWRADASWRAIRDALKDAESELSMHEDAVSTWLRREIAELLR